MAQAEAFEASNSRSIRLTPAIYYMHIQILDKVVNFKETSMKGLFKIFVSDKEEEEDIPLLIEEHQIKTFKKMLLDTKFDLNMSLSYFKLIVSGCAQYAITMRK